MRFDHPGSSVQRLGLFPRLLAHRKHAVVNTVSMGSPNERAFKGSRHFNLGISLQNDRRVGGRRFPYTLKLWSGGRTSTFQRPATCSQTTPSGRLENALSGRTSRCPTSLFTIHLICEHFIEPNHGSLRQGIHRRPKDRLPNRGVEGVLSNERLLESPALRRA